MNLPFRRKSGLAAASTFLGIRNEIYIQLDSTLKPDEKRFFFKGNIRPVFLLLVGDQ
jgi:hypothetical protein